MQWIFMLVGLVLGALVAESLTGALLAGLVGLGMAQALKLRGLEAQNAELAKQLKSFAERFERGTQAIHERLLKVEAQPAAAGEAPPGPAAAASTRSFGASDTGPEPLKASDAVDADTPALAATSASVGRMMALVVVAGSRVTPSILRSNRF